MADKDGELRATAPEGGEAPVSIDGEPKKGKLKLILLILVPLLLLGGGGAGLYFSGMLDKYIGKKADDKKAEAPPAQAFFVEIPDILVNLNGPDGQTRYLRLKVQLEVGSDADQKAVTAILPRVIDQFQTYLREMRVKDLRGSAGIYRLQSELLARVNVAAAPVQVKSVLFQEILIQ